MPSIKKTSEEWLKDSKYVGLEIIDPDGWDRTSHFHYEWFQEEIDQQEFEKRLYNSTIQWSLSKL